MPSSRDLRELADELDLARNDRRCVYEAAAALRACAEAQEALRELVNIIDAAGLLNLSNGVQLGATSWYVKASDRLEAARAALSSTLLPEATTAKQQELNEAFRVMVAGRTLEHDEPDEHDLRSSDNCRHPKAPDATVAPVAPQERCLCGFVRHCPIHGDDYADAPLLAEATAPAATAAPAAPLSDEELRAMAAKVINRYRAVVPQLDAVAPPMVGAITDLLRAVLSRAGARQ